MDKRFLEEESTQLKQLLNIGNSTEASTTTNTNSHSAIPPSTNAPYSFPSSERVDPASFFQAFANGPTSTDGNSGGCASLFAPSQFSPLLFGNFQGNTASSKGWGDEQSRSEQPHPPQQSQQQQHQQQHAFSQQHPLPFAPPPHPRQQPPPQQQQRMPPPYPPQMSPHGFYGPTPNKTHMSAPIHPRAIPPQGGMPPYPLPQHGVPPGNHPQFQQHYQFQQHQLAQKHEQPHGFQHDGPRAFPPSAATRQHHQRFPEEHGRGLPPSFNASVQQQPQQQHEQDMAHALLPRGLLASTIPLQPAGSGSVTPPQQQQFPVPVSSDYSKNADAIRQQLRESYYNHRQSANSGDNRKPVQKQAPKDKRQRQHRDDLEGEDFVPDAIEERLTPSQLEVLDADVVALVKELVPPPEDQRIRVNILDALQQHLSHEWPEIKLHLFGSSNNSFGFKGSDVDIMMTITQKSMKDKQGRERVRRFLSRTVATVANILKKYRYKDVLYLPKARVPIVKFLDPASGLPCDICVNNTLPIINTRLLMTYSCIDPRLRMLVFVIKYWAKQRQVNDPYRGTLSSYAYVMLCIHFLQHRSPPVLPCLQSMVTPGQPPQTTMINDVDCYFFQDRDRLAGFGSKNGELAAQLVCGFFRYFAREFDATTDVVSIRRGTSEGIATVLTKEQRDWIAGRNKNRHLFCVEDPFEDVDLGRNVDEQSIKTLQQEFTRGYAILAGGGTLAVLCEPFTSQRAGPAHAEENEDVGDED